MAFRSALHLGVDIRPLLCPRAWGPYLRHGGQHVQPLVLHQVGDAVNQQLHIALNPGLLALVMNALHQIDICESTSAIKIR